MAMEGKAGSHDFPLLLLTRTLRAFGFGFAAVLVGVHLERRGLSPNLIGLSLTLGLAAASLLGLLLAALASRLGRRLALALAGLGMALTGLDLALAAPSWLLTDSASCMYAAVTSESGSPATIGRPASPPMAIFGSSGISPRNGTLSCFAVVLPPPCLKISSRFPHFGQM